MVRVDQHDGAPARRKASASSSGGDSETISSPSARSSGARRPRYSSRWAGSETLQTTSSNGASSTAASTPRTRSTADGCVKNGITSPSVPVEPEASDRALARGR